MSKFLVGVNISDSMEFEVEAEDETEAMTKAEDMAKVAVQESGLQEPYFEGEILDEIDEGLGDTGSDEELE